MFTYESHSTNEGSDSGTFSIPIVKSCPFTRQSVGVVIIPPKIIAQLNGAVAHKKEWAVILQGERSEDGFTVSVTKYTIPPEQERTFSNVVFRLNRVEGQGLYPPNTVGVLHSHHTLGIGAKFSGTDEEQFNRRFPVSIVIAVPDRVESKNSSKGEARLLGFDYMAEGQVKLPCGSLGTVRFHIVPKGIRDWPFSHQVRVERLKDDVSLDDCPNKVVSRKPGLVTVSLTTDCGIERTHIPDDAFGEKDSIWDKLCDWDWEEEEVARRVRGMEQRARGTERSQPPQQSLPLPPLSSSTNSTAATYGKEPVRNTASEEAQRGALIGQSGFRMGWVGNVYRRLAPGEVGESGPRELRDPRYDTCQCGHFKISHSDSFAECLVSICSCQKFSAQLLASPLSPNQIQLSDDPNDTVEILPEDIVQEFVGMGVGRAWEQGQPWTEGVVEIDKDGKVVVRDNREVEGK